MSAAECSAAGGPADSGSLLSCLDALQLRRRTRQEACWAGGTKTTQSQPKQFAWVVIITEVSPQCGVVPTARVSCQVSSGLGRCGVGTRWRQHRCRPQQPVRADMCRAGQNLPRKSRHSRRNRISRDTDLSMPALEQSELMESAARFLPPAPVRCLAWCFCMGVKDTRRQREAGSSRERKQHQQARQPSRCASRLTLLQY